MESSQPSTDRPQGVVSIVVLFVLVAVLAADQISKALVKLNMSPGQSVPESGLFRLTYVTNSGSAFGFFPNQTMFLVIASLVGIGVLLVFYRTHRARGILLHVSLGLLLGGATGNLVDRVRLGHVIDFIDVGWWPVFNLADSSIVVGLATLLWTLATTRDEAAPELTPLVDASPLSAMSGEERAPASTLERASVAEETIADKEESPWERSEG